MLKDLYKIKSIEEINRVIDAIDCIDIMSSDTSYLVNEKILLKNTLYNIVSEQKNKIISKRFKLNLSNIFKNHIYSARRIKLVLDKFPNVNRNLGSVPGIFLDKVKDREECARKLFDIFAKYSLLLNYNYNEMNDEKICINHCNDLAKYLTDIIQKEIKIEYVGHGVNGNGYKICVENKNYFYKVFYPHNEFHDSNINYLHGGFIEPAFGLFANKNARKNQFVKFYMGRIATKYDRDAFMLTDFLEDDYTRPKEILKIDYITIKDSEIYRFDNLREGKIVDFGGMYINKIMAPLDSATRKLVRVILKNISYIHDQHKYAFSWSMSVNQLNDLQNFIKKYNSQTYIDALNTIKIQNIVSDEILNFLYNIKEKSDGIISTKILSVKDIFSKDLNKIRENIKEYKMTCKTESEPTNEMFDGYLMLDLYNENLCIIFYDIHNNIKSIKIVKKNNEQFNTVLEIKNNMIDSFANNEPFYLLYSK